MSGIVKEALKFTKKARENSAKAKKRFKRNYRKVRKNFDDDMYGDIKEYFDFAGDAVRKENFDRHVPRNGGRNGINNTIEYKKNNSPKEYYEHMKRQGSKAEREHVEAKRKADQYRAEMLKDLEDEIGTGHKVKDSIKKFVRHPAVKAAGTVGAMAAAKEILDDDED